MIPLINVGSRIRELRKIRGISAKEIAISLNVTPSFISGLESGVNKCSLENLEKICNVMGITLKDFFSTDQDMSTLPPDVWEFVAKKENYDILRFIIEMKEKGHSNEMIIEWLKNLKTVIDNMKGLIGKEKLIFANVQEDTELLKSKFDEERGKIF